MTDIKGKKSILFVCMGNICRSPTAEGVLRKLLVDQAADSLFDIDSAGTHAYHIGEPPDPRAIEAALRRGIDLREQRARAVDISDFDGFDLILAMDHDNLALLQQMQPVGSSAAVRLFLSYSQLHTDAAVPDPYYGGANGFEQVLDMLEESSMHLLSSLRES